MTSTSPRRKRHQGGQGWNLEGSILGRPLPWGAQLSAQRGAGAHRGSVIWLPGLFQACRAHGTSYSQGACVPRVVTRGAVWDAGGEEAGICMLESWLGR